MILNIKSFTYCCVFFCIPTFLFDCCPKHLLKGVSSSGTPYVSVVQLQYDFPRDSLRQRLYRILTSDPVRFAISDRTCSRFNVCVMDSTPLQGFPKKRFPTKAYYTFIVDESCDRPGFSNLIIVPTVMVTCYARHENCERVEDSEFEDAETKLQRMLDIELQNGRTTP